MITVKPEIVEKDGKQYKVKNGTYYHADTDDKVIQWLETSRERKQRIRIFYGKDGRAWNEEFDTIGTIGRSTGTIKIPLLIKNARSNGGGAILDHCIVRIDTKGSNGKIVTVYLADNVNFDHFSTSIGQLAPMAISHSTDIINDTTGERYATCKTYSQGQHLAAFMNGKRWSK